jgi:acylphosphatase
MNHVSIRISGKVQGVFFRASTKGKAEQYGINGFVRNEKDGSVYIEAEGRRKT